MDAHILSRVIISIKYVCIYMLRPNLNIARFWSGRPYFTRSDDGRPYLNEVRNGRPFLKRAPVPEAGDIQIRAQHIHITYYICMYNIRIIESSILFQSTYVFQIPCAQSICALLAIYLTISWETIMKYTEIRLSPDTICRFDCCRLSEFSRILRCAARPIHARKTAKWLLFLWDFLLIYLIHFYMVID